jgi:hypothetical protein
MKIIERELDNGNTVKVYYDESPESPREWSNLGVIECLKHRRYDLGDEVISSETLQDRLQDADLIALPVWIYDHGSVSLKAMDAPSYPFNCQWDAGIIGVVYVSKPTIIKEYGDLSDESVNKAIECLKAEVNTYSQWVNGEVYAYVVEDADGETVDSCGGIFAESAESVIESVIKGEF